MYKRQHNDYTTYGEFADKGLSKNWAASVSAEYGRKKDVYKRQHLYSDIERSFGADIQKKWQINAGVRFEF